MNPLLPQPIREKIFLNIMFFEYNLLCFAEVRKAICTKKLSLSERTRNIVFPFAGCWKGSPIRPDRMFLSNMSLGYRKGERIALNRHHQETALGVLPVKRPFYYWTIWWVKCVLHHVQESTFTNTYSLHTYPERWKHILMWNINPVIGIHVLCSREEPSVVYT